jgi:hypothetical protein
LGVVSPSIPTQLLVCIPTISAVLVGWFFRNILTSQAFPHITCVISLKFYAKDILAGRGSACACSPSYSGGWGRRITWVQEFWAAVCYAIGCPH